MPLANNNDDMVRNGRRRLYDDVRPLLSAPNADDESLQSNTR